MKKVIGIILIAAIIVTTTSFIACIPFDSEELGYVKVSINPEVEFATVNGTVVAVNATNEDAEILLSDMDLVGQNIEDAVEEFVDSAKEAGYIDEESEDNEVNLEIICEKNQERVQERITLRLNNYFHNNGIFGNISVATLEQYAEEAFALGVSNGKAKMILRALDNNPDLDIQELKDKEMKDLVRLFKDEAEKGFDATIREEFNNEKGEVKANYADIELIESQIEALKAQAKDMEGEDKGALNAQIATKNGELNALKAQYNRDIDELVEQKIAERAQLRERQMIEKQAKINAQAAKKAANQTQNQGAANSVGR